ncbi:MAG: hypothetical protein ACJAX1_002789, partial [Neolewinella sp.]
NYQCYPGRKCWFFTASESAMLLADKLSRKQYVIGDNV